VRGVPIGEQPEAGDLQWSSDVALEKAGFSRGRHLRKLLPKLLPRAPSFPFTRESFGRTSGGPFTQVLETPASASADAVAAALLVTMDRRPARCGGPQPGLEGARATLVCAPSARRPATGSLCEWLVVLPAVLNGRGDCHDIDGRASRTPRSFRSHASGDLGYSIVAGFDQRGGLIHPVRDLITVHGWPTRW